ncbi:MAG: DUF5668 domain-containing protein [Patescibacteria group bacterium]
MLAAALIVIGAVFLLKNLGIMPSIAWDIVWPVVLIVMGLVDFQEKINIKLKLKGKSKKLLLTFDF